MLKPDDLPIDALKAAIKAWNDNQDGSYTRAFRMVVVDAINAWPNMQMLFRSSDGTLKLINTQEENDD